METVKLSSIMGLRPLDRLQFQSMDIYDKATKQPSFWFYQRPMGDGLIEIRAPTGQSVCVRLEDVYDIRHAAPVIVRALKPAQGFSDAYVLYAKRDRWGDATLYVTFVDDAHKPDAPVVRPTLYDFSRAEVAALARSDVMPVLTASKSTAGESAENGEARRQDTTRRAINEIFAAALSGDTETVVRLASPCKLVTR